MKIEFKFGNSKISCEGKPDDFVYKNDMFKSMLNQPDLDLHSKNVFPKLDYSSLNKMYEKLPLTVFNYYKDIYKAYNEYYVKYKSTNDGKIGLKPGDLPANGHDIYNYVVRYGIANFHLQAVLELNGRLDFDTLAKAVRLSVDAEPVLGCRFIEHDPPYWKRRQDIDKINYCSLEETDDVDKAVQTFMESPLNMENDLMVKVKLIRSKLYEILCIKVNHACCDGTGTKEYIQLLSDIYNRIVNEGSEFIPEPGKHSRKDQDRLFSEFGISKPETAWVPGSENTKATWPFPWRQAQSDIFHFVICKFPGKLFLDMKNYAKARGATINDMLLTAYYRAMQKMGRSVLNEPMEIPVTVDLRRYLPDHKTEGIRNFSGSVPTSLLMAECESFNKTLSRIVRVMYDIKKGRPGLQSAIGLERIEKMPWSETLAYFKMIAQWPNYCHDKCAPVLSNLGVISKSPIKFGDIYASDVYIVPPVVRSPGFLLMAGTYNDVLTLTAGYYETSVLHENIERLLNKIKEEITEGCRLYKQNKS